MFTPQRILIPVDFHHDEKRVLQYASAIVGKNCKAFLLFVKSDDGRWTSDQETSDAADSAEMKVALLVGEADGLGLHCEGEVATGDIVECIVEAAKKHDVDCILMASSARTAVDRMIVKSTHDALLNVSTYPVLALNPASNAAIESDHELNIPRTIVCPIDETAFSQSALTFAADLARFYDGRLVVVTVAKDADEAAEIQRAANSSLEQTSGGDMPFEFCFEMAGPGDKAKRLLAAIEDANADLIVIATHGRSRLAQWFVPSMAESLMTFAKCPVLTVQPNGAAEIDNEVAAKA